MRSKRPYLILDAKILELLSSRGMKSSLTLNRYKHAVAGVCTKTINIKRTILVFSTQSFNIYCRFITKHIPKRKYLEPCLLLNKSTVERKRATHILQASQYSSNTESRSPEWSRRYKEAKICEDMFGRTCQDRPLL